MVNMNASEILQQFPQMPMKIAPPPGLDHPALQVIDAPSTDYKVGEAVLALRSNGSWSKAVIKEIQKEKVIISFKEGVKHIRKEMMGRLLKKAETSGESSEETSLANQTALLEAENARLKRENMMMRLQSKEITSMYDAHVRQDPHGYMTNPWGVPQAACPTLVEDDTMIHFLAAKLMAKMGGKEDIRVRERSWGSTSTASGGPSWGLASIGEEEEDMEDDDVADTLPHERTTVMMRNIPNNACREQLTDLFDAEGFRGRYNLIYLPIDLKNKVGLGYAFINFVTNEGARAFTRHFEGFKNWNMQSEKVATVTWSDAMQGLDEHVERYRDCPVMHESIPDAYKPALFKDGVRVPFPEPTKKIRAPRPWSRRHA